MFTKLKALWDRYQAGVLATAGSAPEDILRQLDRSSSPQDLSVLMRKTRVSRGHALISLKHLYKQGWIATESGSWSHTNVSSYSERFSITPAGRRRLRQSFKW